MTVQNKLKLKHKVRNILEQDTEARNCDVRLTCLIWLTYHDHLLFKDDQGVASVRLRNIINLPKEDAISRWRRKVQEGGEFLPTKWEVAKKRGMNKEEWELALGYIPNQ